MNGSDIEFNRHAVRPIECFREGWRLIKDDYWIFFGITFVGLLIAGVFAPLLLGPMWCGIDICLLRRLSGRQVRLSNLFEGFNFFGPSVVCTLLVLVPTMIAVFAVLGVYLAANVAFIFPQLPQGQGGPPDASFFATYFGLMAMYFVALTAVTTAMYAPCIFMYSLIVEHKMSGLEAFWTTIRALFANFWGVLGLLLLYTVLNFAGTMLCIFGVYLVTPIYFAAFAIAYRQVFPRQAIDDDFSEEPEEPAVGPGIYAGPIVTGIQSAPPRNTSSPTDIAAGPSPE